MEDVTKLKNYLKKLEKTLMYNVDLKLFRFGLIKKNKIDDLLCCIFASLPDFYKDIMKKNEGRKLDSVISYNELFNNIKKKFTLSSDMYLIERHKALRALTTFMKTIERDINYVKANF